MLEKVHHDAGGTSARAASMEREADARLLARFSSSNDQAAFEELVRRHGGMVMGVCRRRLSSIHDAEEAFQATFLVLARKSGTLRRPELLANWLYGVAYRAALKMRDRSVRRRKHEQGAARLARSEEPLEIEKRELRSVLDEEIRRLPPKLRAPLVLCYLEGKTNREVAEQLGWPLGSMSWYLGQARKRLRARLVRRGVVLSGGMLAAVLSHKSLSAAVPSTLLDSTVKAATVSAADSLAGTAASPAVHALSQELLRALFLQNLIRATAVAAAVPLMTLGIAGSAIGLTEGRSAATQAGHPAVRPSVPLNRVLPDVGSIRTMELYPPPTRVGSD